MLSLLIAFILIGAALRLYGISAWEFWGDEQTTLNDSLNNPSKRGLFSLYYFFTNISLKRFWRVFFICASIACANTWFDYAAYLLSSSSRYLWPANRVV